MKRKIGIFTTHPIQYQVPLFRSLGREKNIDAHIFYASNHGIKPKMDKDFNKNFAWDTDMVSGYKYKLLDQIKMMLIIFYSIQIQLTKKLKRVGLMQSLYSVGTIYII